MDKLPQGDIESLDYNERMLRKTVNNLEFVIKNLKYDWLNPQEQEHFLFAKRRAECISDYLISLSNSSSIRYQHSYHAKKNG